MTTSFFESRSDCRVRRLRAPKGMTLGLLLAVSSSSTLMATNLISNSEFANSFVPWSRGTGLLYWSNQDHASNTSSGSARISDNDGSLFPGTMVSECLKIQGGAAANVSVYFKAATTIPSNSKINIRRYYYTTYTSATSCSGVITDTTGYVLNLVPSTSWTKVSHSHNAPSAARAVRLQIEAKSGVDSSTFDLLADGIVLDSNTGTGPAPIFKNGFESGNLSDWAVIQ